MLKISSNKKYLNKTEAIYDKLKFDDLFVQGDWDTFTKRGEIKSYISTMNSDNLPSLQELNDKYHYDRMDADRRWLVRYNNLFADKTEKKDWDIKTINSQTGEEETVKFNGTEYEYNEKLLSDWVTYDNEQIRLESAQERKDNMSWLEKGFNTVTATIGELGSGLYSGISDLFNLIDAAGQWIGSGFEEKAFRNAMIDDKTLFGVTRYNDDFMRSLAEFESNNTYYRNVDGTFTSDFAETMQGVFYSIGEALPMILATYISGGASTAASAYAKGISGFTKGAVKGLTVAQKIAKVAPVVAQTGYYLSMASGRIEDRLKSSPSASTSAVLAEAGWSTLLDYGVNVGMAKLFGPTTMDRLVFGFSGNKGKLTGISKFIVESAREGMEESIQEFTAWFATEVVSWSENSGIYGEKLTFEQISKAFFAGAMSNILMGGLDKATQAVSEHRNLKAFYKENGLYEIEDKAERVKKRNLLKNGYKYLQAFENVKANADAGEVDIQLATSVYSAFRMYATAMGIFTDEDFKDTQRTLDILMQDYEKNKNNANKYINASLIKDFALDLNNRLKTRTEKVKKAIEILKKVNAEKQLQKNKQKELKDAFVKGEVTFVTGKETEKATKKADQIVNKNDDVKGIVTTEQGKGISFVDGWLFIPSDALNNSSVEDIYKTTAERRITEDSITALDKIDNTIVNQILDWYKKYTGNNEADKQLAMKALFFDRTFYKMCLYNADRKMFNVLSMLNDIAKTVSGKNFDDAQYRQAINIISENMRSELRLYLSYLPTQQYNELVADSRSVLTDDDAAFIERQRYEQDVIAKKLNTQKLTKEELASLFNKINSLTIPADEKQLIYDGLQNSDNKVRKFALYQLNNYYNGIFEGKFNDEIYPRIQTTADSMLALFLQQEGITLKDIKQPITNKQFVEKVENKYGKFNNDTKRQYLLDTFNGVNIDGKHYKGFGKDNFTMTIDANNKITVTENEVITDDVIARSSKATLNKQVNYNNGNFSDMKFARPVDKNGYLIYRKTMDKLLNGKLSKVEKSLVTITDIIRDPQRYLSPDVRGQIKGRLNQTNTFAYLNSVLTAASDGSIGIEQRPDGTYEIASYSDLHTFIPDAKKNMSASEKARRKDVAGVQKYVTKDTNLYTKYGTTNDGVHNIDEFIDTKFLPGRLKDVKVHVKLATKENSGSSYQNGIITIREYRPGEALSDTQFYFALMHEFEHAIQEYNNWNTGFDSIQGQASDTLIKDMFEHIPNLFEGYTLADLKDKEKRQDMLNIANDYIYYSTNELGANGLRTQDGFKTYNQIIVQETEIPNGKNVGIRTDIVFPWGSRYSITGALIKKLYALSDEREVIEIIPDKYLTDFNNYKNYLSKLDITLAELYAVTGSNMLTKQQIENLDIIYKDTDNPDKITIEIFKALGIIHDEKNEFYLKGVDQSYIYRTNLKSAVNKNIFKGNDKDIDNFVKWFNIFESVEYYSDSIYSDYADYTHYIDTVYNKLTDFNISLNIENVKKLLKENINKDVSKLKQTAEKEMMAKNDENYRFKVYYTIVRMLEKLNISAHTTSDEIITSLKNRSKSDVKNAIIEILEDYNTDAFDESIIYSVDGQNLSGKDIHNGFELTKNDDFEIIEDDDGNVDIVFINYENYRRKLELNLDIDVDKLINSIKSEIDKIVFYEQFTLFDGTFRRYWSTPIGKINKDRDKSEKLFNMYDKNTLEKFKQKSFEKYHQKYFPKLTYEEMLEMEVPFFRLQEGPYRDNSLRSIFMSFDPNVEPNSDTLSQYMYNNFNHLAGTNYYITIGTIKIKDVAYMYITDYEAIADLTKAKYYKNYPIHIGTNAETYYRDFTAIISDITKTPMQRRHDFRKDLNYDLGYIWDKDFLAQEKIPEIDIILEEGHISKSKDFTEPKQAPSHTRRPKRAEQPTNKGNRQVSRKAAKDTLLEYYTAKVEKGGNLPQMTPNMQTFLKTSKGSKLDKRLMKGDEDTTFKFEKRGKDIKTVITSIEDGNLLQDQVMRFLRKADTMNNYTFDQINKAFFNNSNITSLEELDSIIDLDLGDVYAIRASLRGTEFQNLSYIPTSIDAMRTNIENFKSSPTFVKYMAREKSTAERFYNTPIDKGYARAAIMTYYDGTIDSLAAVAGFVKSIYHENRNTADQLAAQSLDKNLKNKKGDTDDRTMYDKIKGGEDSAILYESDFDIKIQRVIAHFEKLATNAVDAQIEERTKQGKKTTEEQRQKAIDKNLAQRLAKLSGETYDENKSAKQYKDEALGEDSNVIETLLDKWYTRITMEELYEIEAEKISEEVVEAYTPSVTAISKRIRGKINSMKPHLVKHPEQYNNLPSEIKGLIDPNTFEIVKTDDGTILKGKSLNELVELDKVINETAEKVYTNSVVSKEVKKTNERLQKELAKEKNRNAKLTKQVKTYKNKVTKKPSKIETVSNITITSNTEIPSLLDKIMSVSMSKYSKSMVQHLNDLDDDYHLRASMKEFFEQNADNFEQMSTEDALEIMKFLASHLTPDLTSKDARVWTAFAEYTLAYIYQQVFRYNSFDFTQDEKDMLKLIVENARALPGSAMAAVGNSLEMVNPVKVVLMNLKSWQNIDTTTLEPIVDDMLKDVVKGDTDALAKTNKRLYDELLRLYRDNGAVDIYDKILKFQKAAMLSAPATIIRNKVSNEVIKHTNNWADAIGKKVHEAFRKTKLGTKINQFLSKRAKQNLEKRTKAKLGEKATPKQILDEMKNKHVNLDEQYDFVNLEVSEEVEGFTKANLIDSGLLDLLQDGMSKYDVDAGLTDVDATATPFANRTDVAIVKNIVKALKSRITMSETYERAKFNKLINLVFKAQSDDKWIRNTALTYFKKMLQQKVNTDKNFSLKNGLNQTSMGLFVQAYAAAAYDYMHRTNFITTMEKALLSRNRAAYIAWKLIMPFGSSAMNWFIESLDYTPIGIFKGIYNLANLEQNILKKEDKLRSGQDLTVGVGFTQMYARRALGKGIIGTALMIFGMLLGHFGIIAVDEEDDKLKINIKGTDFYVDISNIFTSSSILLGAQLTNPRKGNFEDVFKDTIDMVLDDTLFGNVVDITKYGLGSWAVRLIPNTLAGFVPNLWKSVMRMTNNHEISYSSGFIGAWQNFLLQTLPFFELALPKYIDPYTGEWKSKYRIPALFQFINIISPASVKCYDYSDVEKVYAEHNIHNKMLEGDDKAFGGIQLDVEMLNKKYGKLNNAEAELFINNKKAYSIEVTDKSGKKQMKEMLYKDMNYEQRKSVLNRITTKNAKLAKIYTWTQMGHKYYASKELRAELGSIGASKNVFIGDKGYVK